MTAGGVGADLGAVSTNQHGALTPLNVGAGR
jgi:hypothetical protein